MTRRRKKLPKSSDYSDQLVGRVAECQTVISRLSTCPAWAVIKTDLNAQKQFLDDNWQNITDDKKMTEAKILKLAYAHLFSLERKYAEDLAEAQRALEDYQNQDKRVTKDYDTENRES